MAPVASTLSSPSATVSSRAAVRSRCSCAARGSPGWPVARGTVESRDRLWVTDITEHPTREGKVYCAVVLDVFSRRVVGWSIDSSATAALVTSAAVWRSSSAGPTGLVGVENPDS
jgi:transposase InsO family protein